MKRWNIDDEDKTHYLRNDIQTICGRDASKVKSSSSVNDVDCKMCINSLPIEMTGSLNDIIKALQDNGYGLDGTKPVFIKLVDDKLFIKRSRWINWNKIDKHFHKDY
jgi:hypothetical protein